MSTDEQKLRDIKDLMIPIIKKDYEHVNNKALNDQLCDQLWKGHELKFIEQFEYNMRWSFRLLKPDVPKEVRYLEHEIRRLKVKSDLYGRPNKNRVVNMLKEAINKYSGSTITKYTELRNESLGRKTTLIATEKPKSTENVKAKNVKENNRSLPTSNKQLIYRDKLLENWAENFYDENDEQTPAKVDYWNRQFYILYVEEKSDAEKLKALKKVFFEGTRANSDELYLSDEDLEVKWKNVVEDKLDDIRYVNDKLKRFRKTGLPKRVRQLNKDLMKMRFSRQFYEHNKEDAIEMIKNAAKPYSDQELMWWEATFENSYYTDNETPYGKRMLIIQENTRFYHDRYATWTPKFSNLINKRRKLECDQSKTVEQRMIELKPLNIEANEAWNKQKKTPEEAEKYWEREKQNQKEQIEICDKQAKKFQGTGPRVNQLYWDIENLRLSDAFFHATYDKKVSMYTKTPPDIEKPIIYRDKLIRDWAQIFYNENTALTPVTIDYVNKENQIMYFENKSEDEKLQLYSENDTSYGKRLLIINYYVSTEHNKGMKWPLKWARASNKLRRIECDQMKSIEQRLNEVKPIIIARHEDNNQVKFVPQQAEDYWEREQINARNRIERCDREVERFNQAEPRVKQLWVEFELLRTSDEFYRAPIYKKNKMLTDLAENYTDDEVIKYASNPRQR
ncbi:hypothetical protein WR25_13863 [Diploscapter pachys]|uniref:Uncharacterized protein n=1 Tax=Diploscapter pachys TaxID=2018661 RepID=A0A2A2KYE6_9BILA|nr:hypothetical protein WR25_13863 [Diploscapter pachys]